MIVDTSLSNRLADRLWDLGHEIFVSPDILREVREKLFMSVSLRKWLAENDETLREFVARLPRIFRVAPGELSLSGEIKADPDDDHVLAAALEIAADFIVTEDRHLLDLRIWRGIKIMSRRAMLTELDV